MQNIVIPVVALIAGFILGGIIELPSSEMKGGAHHDQHDDAHHGHDHSEHESLEIVSHDGLPEVMLDVMPDPKSGWNARITTENFRFAPENASTEHIDGEGHAHIYIDGEKINRVYGEWYHLGTLKEGTRVIEVTLSTNDHRELTHDGLPIGAKMTIEVE